VAERDRGGHHHLDVQRALAVAITLPRAYFTMARDGVFFARFAQVHPGFGTPAVAIVALCGWSALLALSGTFDQLLAYVIFVGWIFYALGAAAVIVLRRKRPDVPRPYRVPGYPWTPLLFVAAAVALVINTIVASQRSRDRPHHGLRRRACLCLLATADARRAASSGQRAAVNARFTIHDSLVFLLPTPERSLRRRAPP
jgi:amino acid transporter